MSPPPEGPVAAPLASSPSVLTSGNEFTPEERSILLKVAHESILSALEHREISLIPPSPHLVEPRGAFTTIYLQGALHGCVGYVFPVVSPQPVSLYRAVAETARAAAFEDTRFPPITQEETSRLEVSLSILSPLKVIRPEDVEIGLHGLVVNHAGRRGVLLPQVPVEQTWDRVTFLEQTCRKAGLPLNAWQNGATLQVFTTEVFGDRVMN
jgi:AmmeMemoRadiSam system protein A